VDAVKLKRFQLINQEIGDYIYPQLSHNYINEALVQAVRRFCFLIYT
jgi:hypothetical protein